jgi:polar amino acid transport system substrate-binding protein
MHHRPSVFKACVFLFAASASLAGLVQAADSKLDNVLKRGHLIVGTGSTNAPWHFQGADGKLQGFDIDIGRIVAKGLFNDPSKVEFVVQSSDARIPNLLTDKVDMSCQFITVTASRAQQVAFTLPYYREGVGLLLPNNSKYKEIEDLQAAGDGVTVAVLQNVYAEELVHQALPKARSTSTTAST